MSVTFLSFLTTEDTEFSQGTQRIYENVLNRENPVTPCAFPVFSVVKKRCTVLVTLK